MRRVALVGKAGSGKSTQAKKLEKKYDFEINNFSRILYKIAREGHGMIKKDRKLLQDIGRSLRKDEPDFIIDYTMNYSKNSNKDLVIDDCRMLNEYDYLINNDYTVLFLDCDKETILERLKKRDGYCQAKYLNDITETQMDEIKERIQESHPEYIINAELSPRKVAKQIRKVLGLKRNFLWFYL